MAQSRRKFLRNSGCAALGAASLASSFERFGLINALAQKDEPSTATDYKALVCIFLFGGNDGNNMVVPHDGYAAYASARGALAIPQASLHQITVPSHSSLKFGFHPGMPEMQSLWSQQKLAVMCNVGTLYQPMTRAEYLNGSAPRPVNLFSHEDQEAQHQTAIVRNTLLNAPTGWGGRLADYTESLNPPEAKFPVIVSLAGVRVFATGVRARAMVPSSGLSGFSSPRANDARYNAMLNLLDLDRDTALVNSASDTMQRAIINTDALNQAINDSAAVTTVFPSTGIGNQLRQVARTIARRSLFGLQRQIFLCSIGGFDTHTNQMSAHNSLLPQLSQAMQAFYNATVELGMASQVTTFTLSDFGRTLLPNSTGTDHAWGNHQLVVGGAVRGGDFYGTYPTLAVRGPDDSGNEGRWIPTTALDQFGATLATWYGLGNADMAAVFPNIGRFATQNLGFLN